MSDDVIAPRYRLCSNEMSGGTQPAATNDQVCYTRWWMISSCLCVRGLQQVFEASRDSSLHLPYMNSAPSNAGLTLPLHYSVFLQTNCYVLASIKSNWHLVMDLKPYETDQFCFNVCASKLCLRYCWQLGSIARFSHCASQYFPTAT